MERLTYRDEDGDASFVEISRDGEAIPVSQQIPYWAKRLAAYEDTGVEPENIPTALEMAKIFSALQKLKEYQKAEMDGRLMALPCKVGDTVYVCSRGKICELTICDITEPEIRTKDGDGHRSIDFYPRDFGMYIHLSKEEAKKHLEVLQ